MKEVKNVEGRKSDSRKRGGQRGTGTDWVGAGAGGGGGGASTKPWFTRPTRVP